LTPACALKFGYGRACFCIIRNNGQMNVKQPVALDATHRVYIMQADYHQGKRFAPVLLAMLVEFHTGRAAS
jgi:hypothetical protein